MSFARLFSMLREHSGPSYKSRLRQLLDLSELAARGHLHPSEYFLYGLSRREVTRVQMGTYLSNRSHWQDHLRRLNDPAWFELMDNKWLFQLHFQDIIPLPRFLGVYRAVGGVSRKGTPLCSPSHVEDLVTSEGIRSLVFKPVRGSQGVGVFVVPRIEHDDRGLLWYLKNGTTCTTPELLAMMEAYGGRNSRGFLLQEYLNQHADIEQLAPFTINTVRIVTLLHAGKTIILLACIRLGRDRGMVDNYSQGGYCAYVDPETGVIGPAKRKATPGAELETHHADSGVVFAGRVVPLWNEALRLCVRAASAAPGLRTIGWDLVITPAGPMIIEGNRGWELTMWQAVGGGLLTQERVTWLRELGVPADPRLPPFRPARGFASLLGTWR